MKRHQQILFLTLFLSFFSFSQFNVQLSYDFAFYKTDYTGGTLSKKDNSHYLKRLSSKVEYEFQNNLIVAISGGTDIHRLDYHLESKRITSNNGSQEQWNTFFTHESTLQAFRGGLSIGYKYSLGRASSLFLNINYNHFFVNKLKVHESRLVDKKYTETQAITNEPIAYYSDEQYSDAIDLKEIGYKNRFISSNAQVVFSLGYRYQFKSYFIGTNIGWSPLNKNFVVPSFIIPLPQKMFSFGIHLGYEISKKPETNE